RPAPGRGRHRLPGPWHGQSLCRRLFGVPERRLRQSDPDHRATRAAPGRASCSRARSRRRAARHPACPPRDSLMTRLRLPRWFVVLTVLAVLVALMVAVSGGAWIRKKNAVEGFGERAAVQVMQTYPVAAVRQAFTATAGEAGLGRAPYDTVGGHLLEGFLAYQGESPSLAFYPGEPSWHGRRVDAEEGFSRMLPFAAAWLAAGGADEIVT